MKDSVVKGSKTRHLLLLLSELSQVLVEDPLTVTS